MSRAWCSLSSSTNADPRLIAAIVGTIRKHEGDEFQYLYPEETTFDELAPSETSSKILKEMIDPQMPEFVKKLIEKREVKT